MADIDPTTLGTHGGVAVGASLITSWLSRFFASKEAQEVVTRLALVEQQLGALTAALKEHSAVAIDVALLKRDVQALHERLDGNRGARP